MTLTALHRAFRAATAAALLLAACAHPPQAPPAMRPQWPMAPAPPRVRWAATFPGEKRPPSGWRRFFGVLLGLEHRRAEADLVRPFGVAVAGTAALLLADPDGPEVRLVDVRKGSSQRLDCAAHPWGMPIAVAAGPDGSTFVADAELGAIIRLDRGGCARFGEGALERPTGLAFASGRLYVVDPPRHAVVAFTPEGSEVLRFGERGDEPGQLNYPTAIAAAPDGTLLVVDALHFRIARYAPDGRFLSAFGQAGDEGGAFGRPKGIAVDARGAIYVSDVQRDAVLVFSPAGAFELAVGGSGKGPGRFLLPAGLAVEDGFLYVADSINHRVQVFELFGGDS